MSPAVATAFPDEEVYEAARHLLDGSGAEDRLHVAIDVVWSQVQGYTRRTLLAVTDDVAHLRGVHGRYLHLGEGPVTAVTAVSLDGTVLTPSDYRWRRFGVLYRDAGWGGPASEIVLTYSHGYAVLPRDVFNVCVTAATRLAANPEQLMREETEGYSSLSEVGSGFTLVERRVLDRYRRRTWA